MPVRWGRHFRGSLCDVFCQEAPRFCPDFTGCRAAASDRVLACARACARVTCAQGQVAGKLRDPEAESAQASGVDVVAPLRWDGAGV